MAVDAPVEHAFEEVAPPKGRHGAAAWVSWIARRVGLALLTLWLVSVLVFVATTALGDPVRAILGKDYVANKARVAEITAQLNLDESLVTRYFHWLGDLLTGDLGTSFANGRPVSELIGANVVNTLVLVLISAVVMIPVAFGIAMISTNYRRRRPDTVIQTVLLMLAGLPEFVIGILLVAIFSTTVFHVLPAVTLAAPGGHPWDQPNVDDPACGHPRAGRRARTSPASCAPTCSRCSTATTSSWPGSRASPSGW